MRGLDCHESLINAGLVSKSCNDERGFGLWTALRKSAIYLAMTKWRFILGLWIALGFFQSPCNNERFAQKITQNTHSKLLSGIV